MEKIYPAHLEPNTLSKIIHSKKIYHTFSLDSDIFQEHSINSVFVAEIFFHFTNKNTNEANLKFEPVLCYQILNLRLNSYIPKTTRKNNIEGLFPAKK